MLSLILLEHSKNLKSNDTKM